MIPITYATVDAAMSELLAIEQTHCRRKTVACSVARLNDDNTLTRLIIAQNGPAAPGAVCSNVVGGCGCAHAEPRAILELAALRPWHTWRFILLCTYSPCTNCANIILDSKLIHGVLYHTLTEHDKRGVALLQLAMPVVSLRWYVAQTPDQDWAVCDRIGAVGGRVEATFGSRGQAEYHCNKLYHGALRI